VTALALDLFRRARGALIGWLVGIGAYVLLVVLLYPSMGATEGYAELLESAPEFFKTLMGSANPSTLVGWIQLEYNAWLPLLLGVFAALHAATSVSGEADKGTVEFALSLPVSRRQFVMSRFIVGLVQLVIIGLGSWLLLLGSVAAIDETLNAVHALQATAELVLVTLPVMGVGLLVATRLDDQGRATAVLAGALVVLYMLPPMLRATDVSETLIKAIPFAHFSSETLAGEGGVTWGSALYLLGLTVAGVVGAVWSYERRDLSI